MSESWCTWAVPMILPREYYYAIRCMDRIDNPKEVANEICRHLEGCQRSFKAMMDEAYKEHEELMKLREEFRGKKWSEEYRKER